MDPGLQEMIRTDLDPNEIVEGIIKLKDKTRMPSQVKVVTRFDDIITCRIKRKAIAPVYYSGDIISFKASKTLVSEPSVNTGIDEVLFSSRYQSTKKRQETGYTGEGTVVGVIDWGADFAHPNFIDSVKGSRFLAIWDMSQEDPERAPLPYGYGRLILRNEINDALKHKSPYHYLGYHPGKSDSAGIGAHGTHVLDIAAGNGKIGQQGVAPGAELIFVHLSSKGLSPLANLGDSVRILEALDFIDRFAGARPCVINLSVGSHAGHHHGTSLVEQGLDRFIETRPQRMVCQSTGNYYRAKSHSSGIVLPGSTTPLELIIDFSDKTPNELEIWYSSGDSILLSIEHPEADRQTWCRQDSKSEITVNGEVVGRIYHRTKEPNTKLNNINIFFYKTAPAGKWKVYLHGEQIRDGRFHAWIERDSACFGCQSRFFDPYVDTSYTTGTICNGFNTITVGACNPHVPYDELAPFSSKGPTGDGRMKPDLIAPGFKIQAARSVPANQRKKHALLTTMSGTSMAAPHVAGTAALIYECLGKAEPHVVKNIICSTSDPVNVAEQDILRVGNGKLNIEKALKKAASLAAASKENFNPGSRWLYPLPEINGLTGIKQQVIPAPVLSAAADTHMQKESHPDPDSCLEQLWNTEFTNHNINMKNFAQPMNRAAERAYNQNAGYENTNYAENPAAVSAGVGVATLSFNILSSAVSTFTKGDLEVIMPTSAIGVTASNLPKGLRPRLRTKTQSKTIFRYRKANPISGIEQVNIRLICHVQYNGPEVQATFSFAPGGTRSRLMRDSKVTIRNPLSLERQPSPDNWKREGVEVYPVITIPVEVQVDHPWPQSNDHWSFNLILSGVYGFGRRKGSSYREAYQHVTN